MRVEYVLGITAVLTLILNLFLTWYLMKEKRTMNSTENKKSDIVNFVLKPTGRTEAETEVLATEIISNGNN